MYDYDRRTPKMANVDLNQVLDRPAKADEAVALAYASLVSFKQGMDSMDEIPKDLEPVYRTVLKAVDAVGEARKETTDLRMMARRIKH